MIDFDGTLNAAISEVLGDEVTIVYRPQSGGSTQILGVFTLITGRVFEEDGTPDANVTVATLGFQVSQLDVDPLQDDTVAITAASDGTTVYAVNDVSGDGLGWAYLKLNIAG
jgi:hypothetical protein